MYLKRKKLFSKRFKKKKLLLLTNAKIRKKIFKLKTLRKTSKSKFKIKVSTNKLLTKTLKSTPILQTLKKNLKAKSFKNKSKIAKVLNFKLLKSKKIIRNLQIKNLKKKFLKKHLQTHTLKNNLKPKIYDRFLQTTEFKNEPQLKFSDCKLLPLKKLNSKVKTENFENKRQFLKFYLEKGKFNKIFKKKYLKKRTLKKKLQIKKSKNKQLTTQLSNYEVIPTKNVDFNQKVINLNNEKKFSEDKFFEKKLQQTHTLKIKNKKHKLTTKYSNQNFQKKTFIKYDPFHAQTFKHKPETKNFWEKKKKKNLCYFKKAWFLKKTKIKTLDAVLKNNFLNKLFKNIRAFFVNRPKITLNFYQLNNLAKKSFSKNQVKFIKKNLSKLRFFNETSYINEGLQIILMCLIHEGASNFLANYLARELQNHKRQHFFLNFVQKAFNIFNKEKFCNPKNIKIQIKGRFNNASRPRIRILRVGKPLSVISTKTKIYYYQTTSFSSNGTFGIKIWISNTQKTNINNNNKTNDARTKKT